MTACNFVFSAHQALIVTDTAVTADGAPDGFTTKAFAFPHMRLIVAGTGQLAFIWQWVAFLLAGLPSADVDDLDREAPAYLRRSWARGGFHHSTTLYHFGIDRNEAVAVYGYASEQGFASHRFAPGAYISPPFVVPDPLPSCPVHAVEDPVAEVAREGLPTWRDGVRTVVDAVYRQQRDFPVTIGGRIQVTHLSPYAIHQNWLGELQADTAPELAGEPSAEAL